MKKIVFGVTLMITGSIAQAQDAVVNTGNLKIHTGGSLSVFGNLTNASSASLENDGSLYIKRNLTAQQPSMNSGTGTLYLNGTTSQTLDGTQAFKTNNLVTDNSTGIGLNTDLSVSGSHSFTNGILTTSATNYLVYEAGSLYSGNSDARHVAGWIKKIGTTDFIFPVGNGTVQRSLSVNTLSASSTFVVSYGAATPNSSQFQFPVVSLDTEEYWQVNKVAGGTAKLTLNWDNSKIAFPNWNLSEILVASYEGSAWVSQGGAASGNVATTGSISSNTLTTFSRFTFGSSSFVLPVTLIHFNAEKRTGYTEVSWKTSNEQNVRNFSVERSDNGRDFYTLANVWGRNSGQTESYSVKDNKLIAFAAYYRLRSIDMDGKQKLSPVVRLTNENRGTVQLLQNPVVHQLTLLATQSSAGTFGYTISNMAGLTVQKGTVYLTPGGPANISLSPTISAGTYTISLSNQLQIISKKFIVAKD